jgi:hypothetical protein
VNRMRLEILACVTEFPQKRNRPRKLSSRMGSPSPGGILPSVNAVRLAPETRFVTVTVASVKDSPLALTRPPRVASETDCCPGESVARWDHAPGCEHSVRIATAGSRHADGGVLSPRRIR